MFEFMRKIKGNDKFILLDVIRIKMDENNLE
jgi:hypothetical protein